ncbi:MBL fold metallo-hydrolase [Myroides odoratimimus]|uniref:MBL fold metallo-hydrolase n=1 Tax=Myroides odoratimimus TaxID=76832 RepID=UPI000918F782|nr:MBL fold metallo-hydrolase [Myroides odoratimimus]SHL85230.1 Metallo-beta-lactamase superfamily protein [Myroides odoratimimus subsp. xuanwuensis]
MVNIYHLNAVEINAPTGDSAIGHCTVLEVDNKLVLIDSGIGVQDNDPVQSRFSSELVTAVGLRLDPSLAVYEQLKQRGLDPKKVTDVVVSHLDCDHISGIVDFPNACVHVASEEYHNYQSDNPRYVRTLLLHQPIIKQYSTTVERWRGLEVRRVQIEGVELYLTPLFGHTLGHCGIIYQVEEQRYFYIGDAYYLREELSNPDHPVHQLTEARADNNRLRLESLERIQEFITQYPEVVVYGYHDMKEFLEV